MRVLSLLLVSGLALAGAQAQAVVFKPTGAAASSIFNGNYIAANTINGTGLTGGGLDITEAHATYTQGNHWTTASGTNPLTQWIDWTFATPVTMGAAYIWNHRSNNIASNGGYEPTLFDLTFFDSDNQILRFLDNRALAPDNAFAQRIDFALTAGVARVRFDVEAVQSSPNFTGLAEVAFDTQSFMAEPPVPGVVPEPASWAMMIAGFGLVGASMRRRMVVAGQS